MISVTDAREMIESKARGFGNENVAFENAVGRVLAEDVFADRDFPPYNRAAMDGICIVGDHFKKGERRFLMEGQQMAGEAQKTLHKSENCLEIMTGATLSKGADTVIRYEDVDIEDEVATIHTDVEIRVGQNIHRKGTDAMEGDVLVSAGKELNAGDVGVFASVGKTVVSVKKLPKVAIISTGDELVDPSKRPEEHEIRKSNSYSLQAELRTIGIVGDLLHFDDDFDKLLVGLTEILSTYDVVMLSGGVSKGKKDFVPGALKKIGVEEHFHRIAQKPGKPMWFGSNEEVTVFGFPGNPVSTLACFKLYFKPWLYRCLELEKKQKYAELQERIEFEKSLTYHVPVAISYEEGRVLAEPFPGHGSGDLVNLSNADGFISLPADQVSYDKGEIFPISC